MNNDGLETKLVLQSLEFNSRIIVGTSQYPSPEIMRDAISVSGAEIITV